MRVHEERIQVHPHQPIVRVPHFTNELELAETARPRRVPPRSVTARAAAAADVSAFNCPVTAAASVAVYSEPARVQVNVQVVLVQRAVPGFVVDGKRVRKGRLGRAIL